MSLHILSCQKSYCNTKQRCQREACLWGTFCSASNRQYWKIWPSLKWLLCCLFLCGLGALTLEKRFSLMFQDGRTPQQALKVCEHYLFTGPRKIRDEKTQGDAPCPTPSAMGIKHFERKSGWRKSQNLQLSIWSHCLPCIYRVSLLTVFAANSGNHFPHWTGKITLHQSHIDFCFESKTKQAGAFGFLAEHICKFSVLVLSPVSICGHFSLWHPLLPPIRNGTPVVFHCWLKHQLLQTCPHYSLLISLFFLFI